MKKRFYTSLMLLIGVFNLNLYPSDSDMHSAQGAAIREQELLNQTENTVMPTVDTGLNSILIPQIALDSSYSENLPADDSSENQIVEKMPIYFGDIISIHARQRKFVIDNKTNQGQLYTNNDKIKPLMTFNNIKDVIWAPNGFYFFLISQTIDHKHALIKTAQLYNYKGEAYSNFKFDNIDQILWLRGEWQREAFVIRFANGATQEFTNGFAPSLSQDCDMHNLNDSQYTTKIIPNPKLANQLNQAEFFILKQIDNNNSLIKYKCIDGSSQVEESYNSIEKLIYNFRHQYFVSISEFGLCQFHGILNMALENVKNVYCNSTNGKFLVEFNNNVADLYDKNNTKIGSYQLSAPIRNLYWNQTRYYDESEEFVIKTTNGNFYKSTNKLNQKINSCKPLNTNWSWVTKATVITTGLIAASIWLYVKYLK